jgi:plasminogen activator inhibitor 1 RNA-binding protein
MSIKKVSGAGPGGGMTAAHVSALIVIRGLVTRMISPYPVVHPTTLILGRILIEICRDTEKQVGQGWGPPTGEAVLGDEKAGEAIAKAEENEPQTTHDGEAAPEEPADKAKTLAEYLAEQAEKKRDDLGVKAARAPNEGMKLDKKWESAKEFRRDGDDDQYIKGKEDRAKRERQRKEKNYLDVDMRFVESPRGRGGYGRGRGRGRGGRGDGLRGSGRSLPSPTVDEENFPSLAAK